MYTSTKTSRIEAIAQSCETTACQGRVNMALWIQNNIMPVIAPEDSIPTCMIKTYAIASLALVQRAILNDPQFEDDSEKSFKKLKKLLGLEKKTHHEPTSDGLEDKKIEPTGVVHEEEA